MARKYRKFDEDFKQGAVQLVVETGRPIAQVARDLGINEGTLGNWCARERRGRERGRPLGPDERGGAGGRRRGGVERGGERGGLKRAGGPWGGGGAELERLRREVIELRMQRDVLKRSVALWVDEAMGR